jgi:hypothetical protein
VKSRVSATLQPSLRELNLLAPAGADLLAETIAHSNLSDTSINKEITMLASLLIPYIPMDDAMMTSPTVVVLAQAETESEIQPMYELRACYVRRSPKYKKPSHVTSPPIAFLPTEVIGQYIETITGWDVTLDMRGAKVSILEMPQHGILEPYDPGRNSLLIGPGFIYTPQPEIWLGADQFTALVEFNGQSVQVKIDFVIVGGGSEDGFFMDGSSEGGAALDKIANECQMRGWEHIQRVPISSDSSVINSTLSQDNLYTQLASLVYFSNLSGNALAQTTGTSASAQITLDTDAAGHGWFIDYTPYLNEEYLSTSNPYEWIAKPGSNAEGKIDLLSVLWHELGYAYGLDHTADSAVGWVETKWKPSIGR